MQQHPLVEVHINSGPIYTVDINLRPYVYAALGLLAIGLVLIILRRTGRGKQSK
jgi:hypothetical protein